MNLYDIVEGLRDGTDNPIKLQNRVGVSEDSWFDGQDQWATGAGGGQWSSSDHDNWTKESAGTINPLTGVDEAIGYESNKSYAEVGPYKRYMVYVTKKKFNEKFGFIAVAVNPRTNDAKFKAAGQTQQDAVASLHSEVDKEIDVATKVSGAATIDFNVDFVRDVLEMSSNTFYAKIVPGPKLVIAGKEMEQYPDIMKSEGFKASSIRTVGDSEGATKLPAMPLSATGATTAQLVANGRYALGQETIDRDGNRVFELEFDSVVADPRERIRMGAPAITIGTKRETKEDSSDFMANDSASPVGGNMQFENRLHVGDPVIVTAPNEFEGKTGEISEFSPSGKFVVVNLYNYGEHSMHLSDVEYNEYADRDEDELDEGASVAYVTTYFDTKTGDRGESTVSALTRKEAADKIVQLMHERGYDITVTAVRPAIDEGEVTQTSTGLKHRATKGYGADYEFGKGVELAKQKHHADLNKVDKKLTKSLEKGMDVHFDEGWSDRDREHYAVYVNGKKKIWQDLQGRPLTDNHARNIMYKMREKYRKTGQDPMRITIAPVDYDKDQGVSEGAGQQLSVQQLATISDAALDAAYHYGRSQPGNTFGWQANLKSAAFAKQMIDRGVTDIEAISDAIHKGWNVTFKNYGS
jgi:hypothetical protein